MPRSHSLRRAFAAVVVGVLTIVGVVHVATTASASGPDNDPKPTIVLVHGAFADGSGWDAVVERLQRRGYPVIAPANPLRGLDTDAAYIRSVIDSIEGPVIVAAHSYGGAVVTNAAHGAPNVRALVYIAAFAPDFDENLAGLLALNPGSRLGPDALVIRHHPGGADGYVNPNSFRDVFAQDLSKRQAATMAATQRPADVSTLVGHSGTPAWASIPSWYMVANDDHLIPPATQRFMAERAGATTVEVRSSHVAMISKPSAVTDLIIEAARATA